ncbi:MAG: hypothetical protein L0Z50_00685 [Verrucomicrobiales bacterium]|nr:hypothetical protein [Verrucomicrobiales bacterium]
MLASTRWGAGQLLAGESKGELKFEVQLIWGTNGEKPPGKNLREVQPRITEALKGIFKWKNYFEVTRTNVVVAKAIQRLKLSDKCEVNIQNLGNSSVQIKLLGEGKCVHTRKEQITPGKLITIAGEDKNDTAWFVVLKAP